MISVDSEDYEILKGIFKKYPLTIYAYGSKTKFNHKKFSDLDLCIFDDTYKKLDIFNLQFDLMQCKFFLTSITIEVAPSTSKVIEKYKNILLEYDEYKAIGYRAALIKEIERQPASDFF